MWRGGRKAKRKWQERKEKTDLPTHSKKRESKIRKSEWEKKKRASE